MVWLPSLTSRCRWVLGAALASASLAAGAQVPDEDAGFEMSVGAKVWPTSWESWVTSPKGTGVALGTSRFQVVQSVSSSEEVSPIPFAIVHYKGFFGSLSAMSRTRFTLRDAGTPGGFDVSASRREVDAHAGYYLLSGLAVTLGYKQLTQTYGGDEFRWRGPILGLTGSAPIAVGVAIYGNAGAGRMTANFPAAQADFYGRTSFKASYRLGEFGLAYALPWMVWPANALLLTAGYRAQYVKTEGYALAVTDSNGVQSYNTTTSLKDTTQGFVFGVSGSF